MAFKIEIVKRSNGKVVKTIKGISSERQADTVYNGLSINMNPRNILPEWKKRFNLPNAGGRRVIRPKF
jgi:hypothetical protein